VSREERRSVPELKRRLGFFGAVKTGKERLDPKTILWERIQDAQIVKGLGCQLWPLSPVFFLFTLGVRRQPLTEKPGINPVAQSLTPGNRSFYSAGSRFLHTIFATFLIYDEAERGAPGHVSPPIPYKYYRQNRFFVKFVISGLQQRSQLDPKSSVCRHRINFWNDSSNSYFH